MEDFVKIFHIDWKLMIAQIINFAVVIGVFYFLAAKPLRKLMRDRTSEIETGVENAKKNAETLAKTTEEYEKSLRAARQEAGSILEQGKKEAEQKRAEMVEATKKEMEAMIVKGKEELAAEKSKMVAEAKREISSLVVASTEKVLGRSPVLMDEATLKELNSL